MISIMPLYVKLTHMSKREKIIFYCALIFLSVTVADRFIISPIFHKMQTLNKETNETKTAIRKDLHILVHKDRILSDSKKHKNLLSSLMSDEEEMTSILKEIENLANKSGIYLVDMKPGGLADIEVSKKYTVNLNCEAQMEQLMEFMYSVEKSDKLLTIERYQISPKSRDSSVARCRMTISKVVMLENNNVNKK